MSEILFTTNTKGIEQFEEVIDDVNRLLSDHYNRELDVRDGPCYQRIVDNLRLDEEDYFRTHICVTKSNLFVPGAVNYPSQVLPLEIVITKYVLH